MKRIALFAAAMTVSCVAAAAQERDGKTLVAYFSATGRTEKAAKTVAEAAGGELCEIEPAESYTSADLDWHDEASRSSVEMKNRKARPALKPLAVDPAEYDTVYIGFPIWWGEAPRAVNTFLESADFAGKTVIPFATSGGSGISGAENELRKAYPDIEWGKGRLLNGATPKDVENWIGK